MRVLEPFGIKEMVQSGMVAIGRGCTFDHRPGAAAAGPDRGRRRAHA